MDMGLIAAALMGLLCGSLAKWIMPGPDPGGLLATMGIGIAGGLIGGFVSATLGLGTVNSLFSLWDILCATAGAVLVLHLYRRYKAGRLG